jgi:hypothetical protein
VEQADPTDSICHGGCAAEMDREIHVYLQRLWKAALLSPRLWRGNGSQAIHPLVGTLRVALTGSHVSLPRSALCILHFSFCIFH